MTLEIYDYLWIRNVLISVDAEKLNEINKEEYDFVVKCISNLMQHEDFPLVYPDSQKKILKIINNHRFDYIDKDNVEDINYVIERLNQYKQMSITRKEYLVDQFYLEEVKNRKLPYLYSKYPELIDIMIQNDIHTYRNIFCILDDKPKTISLTVEDILEYVSLTNLLDNEYPNYFDDERIAANTVGNLKQLVSIKQLPHSITRNIKKTIKRIDNKKEEKRLLK